MDELARFWLTRQHHHFISTVAYYETTGNGYIHRLVHVVYLHNRSDVCAACGAEFMVTQPYRCTNNHWPHDAYPVVHTESGRDFDVVCRALLAKVDR